MQIAGTLVILFGMAFWAGHTTKEKAFQPRPPEHCQFFDDRYSPQYEAMCDAWDDAHK